MLVWKENVLSAFSCSDYLRNLGYMKAAFANSFPFPLLVSGGGIAGGGLVQWRRPFGSSVGPTVFRGKKLTNSVENLANSAAHRGKADEIPRLTANTQLNFRGLIKS